MITDKGYDGGKIRLTIREIKTEPDVTIRLNSVTLQIDIARMVTRIRL